MDIPLHLAAAAWTGSVTFYIEHKVRQRSPGKGWGIGVGVICFGAALSSHLLLDLIPHYDLLFKVFRFSWLPNFLEFCWTLCKIGVTTFPVAFLFLSLNRDRWAMVLASIFGGVYPDIEKTLYLHGELPRWLVIAPWHSCAYSPLGWEYTHKYLVTSFEVSLFALSVGGMYWLSQRRRHLRGLEGLALACFDLFTVLTLCSFILKEIIYGVKHYTDLCQSQSQKRDAH
jgi:hypothetical protein